MQLSYQNSQGQQTYAQSRMSRPGEGMFANRIDYDRDLELCKDFIQNYTDQFGHQDDVFGSKKYLAILHKAATSLDSILEVCIDDLENHFGDAPDKQQFIQRVRDNTMSYVWLFGIAADSIINQSRDMPQKSTIKDECEDQMDTLNQFRAAGFERSALSGNKQANEIANLLKRKFDVSIVPSGPNTKKVITPLRQLKAGSIGSLVTIRANVVRTSEVKMMMGIACYVCEACGTEIYQSVSPNAYCPTTECPSETCRNNRVRGKVTPNHSASRFQPFQELRVQETSDQTPMGNIPLSFTVHCKGALTRKCSPGEIVFLTGVMLPKPNESLQRSNDGLLHQVYIEAMKIEVENVKFAEVELGEHVVKQLLAESQNPGTFERLAKSICPEIFGMDTVKQSLLLQMVSGSTLTKGDGVKIRGDINIALIGDPGVAKSQLLKAIAHLTPRGVYTSGKGSSGAGLTAAVIRDASTNEVTLEGGALVLADRGICCIDEFDKMEERDRTSIHEVMEQQSVSIAKAGITTTLNARTSILAAANPVFGRYNRLRSPHENINLPASLLSRFDLIFILLDRPNPQMDTEMADHITYVHQHNAHPTNSQAFSNVYSAEFLKAYIAYAKKFDPLIPQDLFNYISGKYVEARRRSSRGHNGSSSSSSGCADTTPRTLLALIRLSQAHAKIRFSNIVSRNDVDLALDLMASSQSALTDGYDEFSAKKVAKKDPISMIYQFIREELTQREHQTIKISELENKLIVKGYNPVDLQKCISNYSQLDVLLATEDTLTLVK